MPFLFVDYDQGAGGERFCAGLSQSAECETLEFIRYANGRTKVLDVFKQEFLKPNPNVAVLDSHDTLYTLVPTHRKTAQASELLGNVRSIRIQMPTDTALWNQIKENQINKVLMTQEPTPEYFFGLLKILQNTAVDKDFVRRVKYTMSTIEIVLLSNGVEPTEQNIKEYIDIIRNQCIPEPKFNYDLVIPYEDLAQRPDHVQKEIESCFKINVVGDWLNSYA
jgi:hypothetical protein